MNMWHSLLAFPAEGKVATKEPDEAELKWPPFYFWAASSFTPAYQENATKWLYVPGAGKQWAALEK